MSRLIRAKSNHSLYQESQSLNFDRLQLPSDISVSVDDRESDILKLLAQDLIKPTPKIARLNFGDIAFENESHKLLVERKTVSQFSNDIAKHKFSKQLDSYARLITDRKNIKLLWILEAEDRASLSTYHAMPKMSNVDGALTSLISSGQHVIQSFGIKHSLYLAVSSAAKLFHTAKTRNTQRDRASLHPIKALIPQLTYRTTQHLTEKRISIAQLSRMNTEELQSIPSIGPKRAEALFRLLQEA